jgi:hypothetical protein
MVERPVAETATTMAAAASAALNPAAGIAAGFQA